MIKKKKFKRFIESGCIPSDSPEERLRKSIMTIMIIPYSLAGIIWGLYFILNGNVISGLIPLVYGIVSLTTFFYFIYTKRYNIFRFTQVGFILVLPFLLQLSLGGFSQSSGMLLWSCSAPFIALVFYDSAVAKRWFYALIFLLLLACFLDESARAYFSKEIDVNALVAVYGGNFILTASLIFGIQLYFMKEQRKIKLKLEEKEELLQASVEIEKQKELLSASKDRLELVMGSLKEVVWGRSLPDNQMQYVSNSAVDIYGFPIKDWYEDPDLWSKSIHPDDVKKVEKENEVLFSEGASEVEYRIVSGDKKIKWINSKTRIIKSTDGTPFFMTGIAQDITKLVVAKKKLYFREKQYRELFYKSGNPELILKNNVFIECNDATIEMLGYRDATEFLNRHPSELSPEKQPDGHLSSEKSERMNNIAYETGSNRFDWTHLRSNGDLVPVEVLLTAITSEDVNDKTLHVVWRDITEQEKAKEELNQLNNNLEEEVKERTQELEVSLEREKELGKLKTSFVSTASHQFRTPLAVIQSNVGLLEMFTESDEKIGIEKYKKVTSRIQGGIARMTDLMDDVLVLGKLTSGNVKYTPEELDLVEFCKQLAEEVNSVTADGRILTTVTEGEPYNFYLDPKLLMHAVSNLISNAFKYSHGKKAPELGIHFNPKEVVVKITDYGIGIPKDELSHLFEPFFRASNVSDIEGTGLGLSIVKEYIEINKGTIIVNSMIGTGSTFELTFCA